MAGSAGYTLFDDLDEDDAEADGGAAGEDEEASGPRADEDGPKPALAGRADLAAIKVPIMDNMGYVGTPGGLSEFSVFKDSSYSGPTISGVGGPGCANWNPEKELIRSIDRSARLQAEKALGMALQQKDAVRCAACLVQYERLGMDTSTSMAQWGYALADPDYLSVLREAQRSKALEEELREFTELAESGALRLPEEGRDEEGLGECHLADGEELGGGVPDNAPEEDDEPTGAAAREDAPSRPEAVGPRQHAAREGRPESCGDAGRAEQQRPRRRRKSPSLAEKLLLGPNVLPPSSASDENEEDEEEWQLPADVDAQGDAGDPDLQLVGVWQYGSKATERVRISRPERGQLLVDRQLPTGLRASGLLRRGEEPGVLQAALAVKDGLPAGMLRVRPLDARSVAVGLKLSEEAGWLADAAAEKTTLWCCCPPEKRPLGIREVPEFDGPRTGQVLRPGEVFGVSAEQPAPVGGVLWLQLADGRGWVFDRQPGAASLCLRCDLPISGFSVLDGYLEPGGEIHFEELTLEEAKVRCAALPDCSGFCYEGGPKPSGRIGIVFKNRWQHGGSGEETGWTSVRVERALPQARADAAGTPAEVRMTPAEEEDARRWYESISQGWLTRLKPEGANEGGINALEDIIKSMDRCEVADDPELAAVRKGFERAAEAGCTALTPLTREDPAPMPTGKLTSGLRPFSAKEGDDQSEPNTAVARLTGRAWVSEFRKHHPAARVSPGLVLRTVTGEDEEVVGTGADGAETLPAGRNGWAAQPGQDDGAPDGPGREEAWWEQREMVVSEAPSLEERAARIAPPRPWQKAKPKERPRMAMPKARPLTADSSSSQSRARSGILPLAGSSSSASGELGADLSDLFFS